MADQRNQGRDGPPQQGGQRGRQQQRGRGAETGRHTTESRERRTQEWLQHLEESPPEHPMEEATPDPTPAPLPVPRPGPLPGPLHVNSIGHGIANMRRPIGSNPYTYGVAARGGPQNFPPRPPRNLPRNIPTPSYRNAATPPPSFLPYPGTFGHFYPPGPSLWPSHGARVPNPPQLGPQGAHQPMPSMPMPPMPMGNHGNWQGAGAARNPGQVVRAPVNPQPRNSAASNAANNRSADIQQPAVDQPSGYQPSSNQPSRKQPASGGPFGKQPVLRRSAGEEPSGEQPSRKRTASRGPAGEETASKQPAPKRHAGGGRGARAAGQEAAGEALPGDQPANDNTGAAEPTNPATMSISERLERNLITDVAGLTRAEEDELIIWARSRVPKIPWETIRTRYKFKIKQDTLRGRWRKLEARGKPLPRKPVFTERDNELLLEAIEHLAGGHLDNVDNTKIKKLWTRAKAYIKEHGGHTTAGPSTIKKKYKALSENVPEIRRDLKPGKAKWDHKAYEKFKVHGKEEASFDNNVKGNKPTASSGTRGGGPSRKKPEMARWNHGDYKKFEVEHEEGADFEETDEEEEEGNEERDNDHEDNDHEDDEAENSDA